jgi:hypothetical protein
VSYRGSALSISRIVDSGPDGSISLNLSPRMILPNAALSITSSWGTSTAMSGEWLCLRTRLKDRRQRK